MSLPFPNVPFLPGVPQIPRSPQQAVSEVVAFASQSVPGLFGFQPSASPSWAILNSAGKSAVKADSFLDFGNQNEANIPNFPIQEGGFATYNKVILPYTLTLRLSKGGSQSDRTQFLINIEAMWQSLDLYTIITPELNYENMNLERYEVQRRGAGGAFFLTEVDLFFIEIQEVSAQYSNTTTDTSNAQNPSAQPVTNTGNTQTATPSAEVQSQVTTGLDNTSGYPAGF